MTDGSDRFISSDVFAALSGQFDKMMTQIADAGAKSRPPSVSPAPDRPPRRSNADKLSAKPAENASPRQPARPRVDSSHASELKMLADLKLDTFAPVLSQRSFREAIEEIWAIYKTFSSDGRKGDQYESWSRRMLGVKEKDWAVRYMSFCLYRQLYDMACPAERVPRIMQGFADVLVANVYKGRKRVRVLASGSFNAQEHEQNDKLKHNSRVRPITVVIQDDRSGTVVSNAEVEAQPGPK